MRVYSLASQTARVYEVSAGAWTQRDSTAFAITSGVAFTMDSDVRAGGTDGHAPTIPAGQIGLWVSDASNNSFDNFKAHDLAGPFEVDGRWFSNSGDVQVDASNSNLISIGTASDKQVTIVRRGFRAGKYVLTYRFQWISGTRAGPLVRWVNPGDWIAVQLFHSDGKARLSKREADGNVTQLVTGTNCVSRTAWTRERPPAADQFRSRPLMPAHHRASRIRAAKSSPDRPTLIACEALRASLIPAFVQGAHVIKIAR